VNTYVYVDGFNYYYRIYRNSRRRHAPPARYKWLNIHELCKLLVPGLTIGWIGYFTAFVAPNPRDPRQHIRQRAYLEALGTISCLEIVPGNFQSGSKWGVPVNSTTGIPQEFRSFEEKGSDVNIAARLVWDAARGAFDEALLISNDSDLREAVRIVTQEIGLPVHVLSPDVTVNNALKQTATSAAPLNIKLLKRCQFPNTLVNAAGIPITRPGEWT
jgi:NYN domain